MPFEGPGVGDAGLQGDMHKHIGHFLQRGETIAYNASVIEFKRQNLH